MEMSMQGAIERLLIVDPPDHSVDDLRREFESLLAGECQIELVRSDKELAKRVAGDDARTLVIIHAERGDGRVSGWDLIRATRARSAELPIVAVSDYGEVASASQAIESGANDFLVRGDALAARAATLLAKMRGLFRAIERARELDARNAELQRTIQARYQIVGESPEIRELVERVKRIARVPRPVLITGERGTGKELVARSIHAEACGASKPIVTVNCAAFSDALLESELFGHEKGAFTGADDTRQGKFEMADGGTLFLDEISHMSPSFQQKILRVAEYGTFMRVGGQTELKTTARIISATNVDLRERIREGKFQSDLYDRLAFEVIEVPALRDRTGDVEVLAQHFLDQFSLEIPAFRGKALAASALVVLGRYAFPGNVRELKNIIERAAYRDTTNEITPEDIGMLSPAEAEVRSGSFQERVTAYCQQMIHDAMTQANGNQAEAARLLGLSYHQFRYHLRKHAAAGE